MSRQNCKNCGEPYTFDNLVTHGRATMLCAACQRKIYVHTGQIYLEPIPAASIGSDRVVPVAAVESVFPKAAVPGVMNAAASSPSLVSGGGWKRSSKTTSIPVPETAARVRQESEWKGDDSSYSFYEICIIGFLYIFFLFWIGCAVAILLFSAYPMEINSFLVAVSAFFGIISLAMAEAVKTVWGSER